MRQMRLLMMYPKLDQIMRTFLPWMSDHGPANRVYNAAGKAWRTPL